MAITNGYCTLAELKADLSLSDTDDDTPLERAIEATSRLIDGHCKRRFWADADATSERFYTADHTHRLDPRSGDLYDDIITLTSLETGTGDGTYPTTWASTDYVLLPLNAAADSLPYTRIEVAPKGTKSFPTATNAVKVTAKFGWSSVPVEVAQACLLQASRVFKRAKDAPFGVAGITLEGGGVRLLNKLDVDVELLLADLRRAPVLVG